MRDLVVACAAGKVDGQLVLDLTDTEDKNSEADMPVAIMPNFNAITLLQMDGRLTSNEFEKTLSMAIDGCKQLYTLQKETLKSKYVAVEEEVEE
jgi:exosome complex component RRP41